MDSPGGLGRARSPTVKHFDAIYTVKQPYKSTLMFNVLPGTEISVHAEFSHCQQNWYYGLQAMYSSIALKLGGGVQIHTHLDPEKVSGTPTGSPPLTITLLCAGTFLWIKINSCFSSGSSRRHFCLVCDDSRRWNVLRLLHVLLVNNRHLSRVLRHKSITPVSP